MDFLQSLLNSIPGAVGQGLMWGIMAIGVYVTYRLLDVADLTVDGSLATGGALCVLLTLNGMNIWMGCSTPAAVFPPFSLASSLSWPSIPSTCGSWAGAPPPGPRPH